MHEQVIIAVGAHNAHAARALCAALVLDTGTLGDAAVRSATVGHRYAPFARAARAEYGITRAGSGIAGGADAHFSVTAGQIRARIARDASPIRATGEACVRRIFTATDAAVDDRIRGERPDVIALGFDEDGAIVPIGSDHEALVWSAHERHVVAVHFVVGEMHG